MDWTAFPRERVNCLLCGSVESVHLSTRNSWPVVRCTVCGLTYLAERPVESALEQVYSREYYEGGEVGYGGYVENFHRYESTFRRIFDRRLRDLEPFSGSRRLLDVGCAHGFLMDHFRQAGWDVRGVEASPLSSGYARDELKLDVHTGSLESAGFSDCSFDAVLLLDVLEHLHRPFDVLSEIGRILVPDGILLVQCPWELYHWEEIIEALLHGMKPGTIEPDAVPAHLYFFQPGTLDAFIEKGGYSIIRRQSGNYGEIRRLVFPPDCTQGSPVERAFRHLYFRMGVQRILYGLARRINMGNGLIRYARFSGRVN